VKRGKLAMAGEPFGWRVLKLSVNFKEILPHARGNFKEQNNVLEPPINYY
jgi:hypothetical protein